MCEKQCLYLNTEADLNADFDTSIPRFPNGSELEFISNLDFLFISSKVFLFSHCYFKSQLEAFPMCPMDLKKQHQFALNLSKIFQK